MRSAATVGQAREKRHEGKAFVWENKCALAHEREGGSRAADLVAGEAIRARLRNDHSEEGKFQHGHDGERLVVDW